MQKIDGIVWCTNDKKIVKLMRRLWYGSRGTRYNIKAALDQKPWLHIEIYIGSLVVEKSNFRFWMIS